MNNKGLTLIELMVVIAIIAMLASFALTGYRAARNKVKVESEIKALYGDLQNARLRAFAEKRAWGIYWGSSPFTSYDVRYDTDGDGNLTDSGGYGSAGTISNLEFPIKVNTSSKCVIFKKSGLTTTLLSFYIDGTEAEYDCISVSATRIKMGKWDGSTCVKR